MLKLFVILVCLSLAFGVGYSTSTVAPTKASVSTTPSCSPSTNSSNCKPTVPPTFATKPKTSPTTPKSNGTTTPKATNGTTTPKTTNGTTTPKTTNGTTTPKTTNGTTTPKPTNGTTTPKPTNGTTTPKPTNGTTTSKTTPTTKPPTYGDFSLKHNNTKYCLLARFAATFTIEYMKFVNKYKNDTKKEKAITYLNRTNEHDVDISGDCGINKKAAKLFLSWPKNESYYTLMMEFNKVAKALDAKNNTNTEWKVNKISLRIILKGNKDFMNATEQNITGSSNEDTPSGEVGGYYSCESKTDLNLKTGVASYSVDAGFQDLKVEPFVAKNASDEFGKDMKQCYQDNPTTPTTTKSSNNDIVPIAVGCALAGLVLIVLIAYIIGRRKSHRGYEKV